MVALFRIVTLRRFGRFLVVGSVHTGATYLLYLVLILVLPYKLSFTIVFIAGVVLSYFLNSTVVFRVRTSFLRLIGFGLYCFLYYLLSLGMLAALVELLKIDARLAPILVLGVMLLFNFFAMQRVLTLFDNPSRH